MMVIVGTIPTMKIPAASHPPPDADGARRSLGECGKQVSIRLSFAIGECIYWCVADLSVFALGRALPPPPPPPPSPTTAVPAVVTVEEMLLAREEEALTMREEKVRIFDKSLAQVSAARET
jgi:hypothetical protein